MSRLSGKTAVITGGGSGIGLGAARRFVEEGAFVYIFGRRQAALDAALAELGPNARAVRGSVTEAADLDRLYEAWFASYDASPTWIFETDAMDPVTDIEACTRVLDELNRFFPNSRR